MEEWYYIGWEVKNRTKTVVKRFKCTHIKAHSTPVKGQCWQRTNHKKNDSFPPSFGKPKVARSQWKRHLIPRIERNDWQLKHRQRAFLREDEQKVLQVFMKRKHTHSQYQACTWIEFQSFLGDFRNLTKNNEWKTFLVYAVRLCLQNKATLKRQKPSLVALVQCDHTSSTKVTPFNSKDPHHRGLRSELGWTWHLFHGKRDPVAAVLQMNLFRLHDHPRK